MTRLIVAASIMSLSYGVAASAAPLPTDEAGAIAFFKEKGARITQDADGHATSLFSSGDPPLSIEELQLIGRLTHLESLALNAATAGDDDWGFLRQLPKLKRLKIWHGHHFRTLRGFNGIPVEELTIGGCMGLRNLNGDDPDRLRNAIVTLDTLPHVRKLILYHSPIAPDETHIAHVVERFPSLTTLRLDFAAPRGSTTKITPDGLARLSRLKLERLEIENAHEFTPDHFAALASIETLKNLHISPGKGTVEQYRPSLKTLQERRPDIEITFQPPKSP